MTFVTWLKESIYWNLLVFPLARRSILNKEIATAMEAAWHAGYNEGYDEGCFIASEPHNCDDTDHVHNTQEGN